MCRKKCNRAHQILFYAKETSRAYVFTEKFPVFFYLCRFFPVEDPQSAGTKAWLNLLFYFSFPSFPLLFPFVNRTVSSPPPLVRVDLSSYLNEMRSWPVLDREAGWLLLRLLSKYDSGFRSHQRGISLSTREIQKYLSDYKDCQEI